MKVTELAIPGVMLVEPKVFGDKRGYFCETWQAERYASEGIRAAFLQDNLSSSTRGVLRGLHLQNPFTQAKLLSVLRGAIFDVAVDVRVGSPTFGQWVGVELNEDNHHQLFVPRGCAHGFCVVSETALVSYKCDELYHPETELGVRFDDSDIGIQWPKLEYVLSPKDSQYPRLREIPEGKLPRYER
jgi:dTDP-4-dehydrorhamnose 3,5-epimerase